LRTFIPIIFWSGGSKGKTIFKLQKRQLFKDLNLHPLPCVYIFELVCYIKSHFGKLDQNIAVHNHNTRQKLNFHVQFCRTNVFKNGVMNIGIRLHNKIPSKIRKVGKIRHFKRVFRSYLAQHMFYSVEEYMLS
jgi:hypothetical protein